MDVKFSIKLDVDDVASRGRDWVAAQMVAAGMRLFPHRWRSDGRWMIIEGVVA